jgi:hypothetical protein
MKKLTVSLVTGILAGMSFIGCDMLNDPVDDDTVDISLTTFSSITAGSYVDVVATVDANVEITEISVEVTKDGAEVSDDLIDIQKQQMPSGEKKIQIKENGDMEVRINVDDNACIGDYVFSITATAGSANETKTNTFSVSGGRDCSGTAITTKTLEAGANQNSTLGSSIDLDGGEVWKMSAAASHVSEIDICYSHTASNGDKVGSPYWAQESDYDYALAWDNPPQTEMHEVSISSATFDGITTAEEIEDLWEASSGTISLTVVQGDIFIVKTTENAYALVRVTEQTPGATGSITIKVAR